MGQKVDPAQELDARAFASSSLAEAQALHAAADRLRRARRPSPWSFLPLFRN
jgi:hypothetical protein